jgi:uncharacterized protein involved in exopolysaccharide biosynthesis
MLGPPRITDTPPPHDLAQELTIPRGAPEENGHVVGGVFEPPSSFPLAAIGRGKLIVLACAVVLAIAGVLYGHSRPSVYTASATLQVGQVNPNSPGFFGYEQSAASLANSFSRSVDAEPVLAKIQRKLGVPPSRAAARLSAEPLPVTPAFRVIGTGPSASGAMALTNVAAAAVIGYEGKSNNANPEASALLHEYREASLELRKSVTHLAAVSHDKHASATEVAEAEAERSANQVRVKAIGDAYVSAVGSQAPSSGLVTLVAGATSASSDHSSKMQRYGLVGLLAGLVLGCAAAVLRERRRIARRLKGVPQGEMPRSQPA